jgi:hypothetical protein
MVISKLLVKQLVRQTPLRFGDQNNKESVVAKTFDEKWQKLLRIRRTTFLISSWISSKN